MTINTCGSGCNPASSSNINEVAFSQLKREVEKLIKEYQQTELQQNHQIADCINFVKTNLSNSIRSLLDSMLQSGELDEIIEQSLLGYNKFKIVNNIQSIKCDTYQIGDVILTLGYYEPNDGGSALYKVREYKTIDEVDNIFIIKSGSLVAELINKGIINAKQIGCKTDGSDNASILNLYFSKGNNTGIYFPNGNYSIKSEIDTIGSVIMDHNAYFVAAAQMNCCIHINKNYSGNTNFAMGYPRNLELKINVECNKLVHTGIRTDFLHWAKCTFTVNNPTVYGVYTRYDNTKGHAENTYDIQVAYDTTDGSNNATGICINGHDDIYNNITTINTKYGVELRGGDNSIGTLHGWLTNSNLWSGSTLLKLYASKNHINQLICDTMETGIKLVNTEGTFGLFIDFMYGLINNTFVNSTLGTTYKIWDMNGISATSMRNSLFAINNYVGNDTNTSKINLGGNGECPYNTKLGYSNDYLIPTWSYSLDYVPEGEFNFNGNSNVKGKPGTVTNGTYTISTRNMPYGKIQELMTNSTNVETGNTTYNMNNAIPVSNFLYFFRRVFNKYGTGTNAWGSYASYYASQPTE